MTATESFDRRRWALIILPLFGCVVRICDLDVGLGPDD